MNFKPIPVGCYLVILASIACNSPESKESLIQEERKSSVDYVNPFIGTAGHGHTFPGATIPFGMVQLSPDTYNEGWDWCSGYHDTDRSIMGFSHTHLSGTGRGELLDVLLMPTVGPIKTIPGKPENPDEGYRSRFRKEQETASPGYYSVFLDDYKVKVELTVTPRAGFHRYTFPETSEANVIIDLFHGRANDQVIQTNINIVNDTLITGFRHSRGWGEGDEKYWCDHTVFFAAVFSKPFTDHAIIKGEKIDGISRNETAKDLKANVRFTTKAEETVFVKVGISSVSIDGALNNVMEEIPSWDFDGIHDKARNIWSDQLNAIKVESTSEKDKEVFYTALYHSMIAPSLYTDIDGRYMGFDKKVHQANGFEQYSTFSLWDTFRAAHPLFTILQPERVNDMVNSMLTQYQEYGLLPVWPLQSSETNCMIGYHAVPVIVDAYLKGIHDFDAELAFEAIKKSGMQEDFDIQFLKKYNFIPRDLAPTISVAKTLEYAFDDYCIAQMAQKMGKDDDYNYFSRRSRAYENLFDTSIGFMRGKNSDGSFRTDFDPYNAVNATSDFVEGNAWQYTWFVPHNVQALVDGMGGEQHFTERLDSLFNVNSALDENTPEDVSGLIGQYAHGNEPSHHVAYLYNYAGMPWKTQEKIHEISTTLYHNTPAGLCGNEDCGQMSAWFVFSALGFYPVNPAEGIYVIGTPLFTTAKVDVGEGKEFMIRAKNISTGNIYIKSASLNGQPLLRSWITHEELMNGGELVFEMAEEPNKELWIQSTSYPPSMLEK